MELIDSITKQIINAGDEVIMIMMVNSRSEVNDLGLLTMQREQYQLISLPIKAKWSEYGLNVIDENQFAVQTFLKAIGQSGMSYSEGTAHIRKHGHQLLENPHWNCSSIREFSTFVVKPETLDKMAEVSAIKDNVPLKSAETHLSRAIQFTGPYLEAHKRLLEVERDDPCRGDLFDALEDYGRIVQLRDDYGYNKEYEFETPYASHALKNGDIFSYTLRRVLHRHKFITDDNEFNHVDYADFYKGVHMTAAIMHAMAYLDIPLAPAYFAQSERRTTAKMELLSKVLIEELSAHCEEIHAYSDSPAQELKGLISPLKSCVSELTRLQQRLESGRRP